MRGKDYDVKGDPKDAYSARQLFEQSPKQFEIWAVGLVAGVPQPDKSGDKGRQAAYPERDPDYFDQFRIEVDE